MKLLVPVWPLAALGLGGAPAPTATIIVRNALPLERRAETSRRPLA